MRPPPGVLADMDSVGAVEAEAREATFPPSQHRSSLGAGGAEAGVEREARAVPGECQAPVEVLPLECC